MSLQHDKILQCKMHLSILAKRSQGKVTCAVANTAIISIKACANKEKTCF